MLNISSLNNRLQDNRTTISNFSNCLLNNIILLVANIVEVCDYKTLAPSFINRYFLFI